ncbi:hypothetical protein BKA62DRAFT_724162, partial [Auriculariales sp. MPI-PUGE-AT-0066]
MAWPDQFVTVATHGRTVSEAWWKDMRLLILGISEQRWRHRKAMSMKYNTPQELVDEIETQGPCEECNSAVLGVKQILMDRSSAGPVSDSCRRSTRGIERTQSIMTGGSRRQPVSAPEGPAGVRHSLGRALNRVRVVLGHAERSDTQDVEMQGL